MDPIGSDIPDALTGLNGVPRTQWEKDRESGVIPPGPLVSAAVNGVGGGGSVHLGSGAAHRDPRDFILPLNGLDWFRERVYSSLGDGTPNWQGESWWSNEMTNLTVAGAEGASDVTVEYDPYFSFKFIYGAGSWSCEDNYPLVMTFTSGGDEYTMSRPDGFKWVFHDSEHADAGKLKRLEDAYGNDWAFTYDGSSKLTDVVIDVVSGADHKITYTYFTTGDNTGLLQYVKVYKSTTTTDANLIGQMEYVYHSATADDYGSEDDLMKVIIKAKGTNDGDGVLSIESTYHYRYYKGTYNASTNPGTDHQLKMVLHPENADRLNTAKGDPLTQTNDDFDDYANIIYEYDSNGRVRQVDERLTGAGCGCGGSGDLGTTTFTWSVNTGSPDADTWMVHCVADREDNSRVIFDVNRRYMFLSWVVQDENDGTPNKEWIWHWDYGASGDSAFRLTATHNPSACAAYDESAPYGVTVNSGSGLIHTVEYDTGSYASYPKKIRIKKGSSGTPDTLRQYARTITERPDLVTTVTEYESAAEADGRSSTATFTFYDAAKEQIKQIDTTHPLVSTAKNGPGASAVTKQFFDKRTGALRWTLDGEGHVNFYAYEDETGVQDLTVVDANTSTLMTVIDDNWDGTTHADLSTDDSVPFSRSGTGTALDIDSSLVVDWLGRARKSIDAEGMITYWVYKDDETRVYPAWDTGTNKTKVPTRLTLTDKDGRPEELITLKTSFTPNVTGGAPNGTATYVNNDMATRNVKVYNKAGQVTDDKQYHTIPATGDGAVFTNFDRTQFEYDNMGRPQYTIAHVADESTYDREQVTQRIYDVLGRLTETAEKVSDNTHDISAGKPAMITTALYFYDDPDTDTTPEHGVGDGNLSWVRRKWSTGAQANLDTEYRYDWRNRRDLTISELPPHTLVKHDNLDRVVTVGQYSATTNLDPGDDPAATEDANRIGLSKTHFDETGRVYKTETFEDPADTGPADALVSNTYYDRRGLVWATDPANSGVSFTQYDGVGRRTRTLLGTQFDTAKYTGNVPDYPDDDEGIIELTDFTLDEVGNVEKIIRKELHHNDTDGMDLTNNDDYIRTYTYHWYDGAHRLTDTVNFGTNSTDGFKDNSTAPTYGSSAPTRSDTALVTTYAFDEDGRRNKVTDPKNVVTLSVFDDLGRVTDKKEADGTADQRITKYAYDGLGSLTKITADLTTDQVTEYVYGDGQNARWVTKIKYPATDTDNGKTLGQPSDETYDRIVFDYDVDGQIKNRTDQNGTLLAWAYDALRRKEEVKVTTVGTGVNGDVRALTWTYTSDGLLREVTSHSDTIPDTSTWTDAVNQIKYTYDAGNHLTQMELDHDSEVGDNTGVDTRSIQFTYDTDFGTNYYKRVKYVTYPSGRKVWLGYTHSDTANTLQDTVNDTFNRVGQLAWDNAGAKGDLVAQYDFNGMGRMVRRNHVNDTTSGWDGNGTRIDLWHATSGDYDGLDRFGRIVDMKHVDIGGSVDFDRYKYGHDRAGNRTYREDVVNPRLSQEFSYNNLYQLTSAERGYLNSSKQVEISVVKRDYTLDVLGNLTQMDENSVSDTLNHLTNQTNEITQINRDNESGAPKVINDNFGTDCGGVCLPAYSSIWVEKKGDFAVTTEPFKLKVNTLHADGDAVAYAGATYDDGGISVEVTFPTSSSTNKAGVVYAHDGNDSYYAVVINRNTSKLELYQVTAGSFGSALASSSNTFTISDDTAYVVKVRLRQRFLEAEVVGQANSPFTYSTATEFGAGRVGMYSDKTDVKFDDYLFVLGGDPASTHPRWFASASATYTTGAGGNIQVDGASHGGEELLYNFADDNYIVQWDVNRNGGADGVGLVRYVDPNNHYRVELDGTNVVLRRVLRGERTQLASAAYTDGGGYETVKVLLSGTTIKVWADATLKINTTDSNVPHGGFGLTGEKAKFQNIKLGYDNNADDDIDDAGDDVVYDDDYTDTQTTVTYDNNGNLTADGSYKYTYDAWNRLVKVETQGEASSDVVTIGQYQYDALGRRIKKVVTHSGTLDGTQYAYYNNRWQLLETRNGSEIVESQTVFGTQYVDEIVRWYRDGRGAMYVFQDANWNVTSTVSYMTQPLDRIRTTPYGQPTFDVEIVNGDWDDDGDTDSADGSALLDCFSVGDEGDCRIYDYDDNGTINLNDYFDLLALMPAGTTLQRQPGRPTSPNHFPFAHQGLVLDEEIGSYQNRRRQYNAAHKLFAQRDPIAFRGRRYRAQRDYVDGLNLYTYATNSPVGKNDASGLACGSGWTDSIVPDYPVIPGGRCRTPSDFTFPCQKHDDCYETCGNLKVDCDNNFHLRMDVACAQQHRWNPICKCECGILGDIYYFAVVLFGDGAYWDAQADGCGW